MKKRMIIFTIYCLLLDAALFALPRGILKTQTRTPSPELVASPVAMPVRAATPEARRV